MKAVLFDLDGTLLPMDEKQFTRVYFGYLAEKLAPFGFEKKALIDAVWRGTAAMVRNDGSRTNEEVFWEDFAPLCGDKLEESRALIDEFYTVDFQKCREHCGFTPKAAEIVRSLKAAGMTVVLATNPIFPAIATQSRIRWAGLSPDDFALVTTYENIGFCKPNLDYSREILRRLDLPAQDCLMVGNNTDEDMIAAQLGMDVFLLTDCMINQSGADISGYPHGDFEALEDYLELQAKPLAG